MRRHLLIALPFIASLAFGVGGARAVVVDMNALGSTSVPYNPSSQSGYVGVALVPGTGARLATNNIPTVASSSPCTDPALTPDLRLADTGICSHGGPVIDGNETFAITWDPNRTYWSGTRGYVEQFAPAFVVPSAVPLGDTIVFDGSTTASTLIVPNANYRWDFGDGTSATGPSAVHTYAAAGNYTVTLTVTDRGANVATLQQIVQVLTAAGLPAPPSAPAPSGGSTPGGTASNAGLKVQLQLLPQALRGVLRRGVALRVSSNEPANGFATLLISRKAARRAHLKTTRRPFVVIGTGTVGNVKDGTVTLHLRMSRAMAKKLSRLKHVTVTVRLALIDSAGKRVAVDVAGNY